MISAHHSDTMVTIVGHTNHLAPTLCGAWQGRTVHNDHQIAGIFGNIVKEYISFSGAAYHKHFYKNFFFIITSLSRDGGNLQQFCEVNRGIFNHLTKIGFLRKIIPTKGSFQSC